MPNDDQIANWDGAGGEHWATEAARYDTMLGPFTVPILEAARLEPGHAVLDIGCGCGALTLAAAERVAPSGRVDGVDISQPMLDVARRRSREAGYTEVTFEKADAQVHHFASASYDAVVSRFGVMFFDDRAQAFANVASAVKPGGRISFACWQEMPKSEWIMAPLIAMLEHVPMPEIPAGGPGPFALAEPDLVTSLLTEAGFESVTLDDSTLALLVGRSLDDVIVFYERSDLAKALLADADAATLEKVWESVRRAIEPYATGEGVVMQGGGWIVSATRAG